MRAKAGRLKDSQFDKRRVILGYKVLVRSTQEAIGAFRENFPVRIKHPSGDIDINVTAAYYWQAFNVAKKHIVEQGL